MAHSVNVRQYFINTQSQNTGDVPSGIAPQLNPTLLRTIQEVLSNAAHSVSKGAHKAFHAVTSPFQSIGAGLVEGGGEALIKSAFIQQGKDILHDALLAESPEQIQELSRLLKKAAQMPDELTAKDIKRISELYQTFNIKDFEQLGLTESGMHVLNEMRQLIPELSSQLLPDIDLLQDIWAEENPLSLEEEPTFIREACKEEKNKKLFEISAAILSKIVQIQQGCLRNAVDYVTFALLAPQEGLLDQLIDTATNKEKGLIRKFAASLQIELNRKDKEGILPTLEKNLGERLESLEKRLTTPLHADLATLRKCLAECETLLKKNPLFRDEIERLIGIAYAKVRHINKNSSAICPKELDPKEKKLLAALEKALQNSLEKTTLTLDNVQKANKFLDGVCQKQMGSLPHLGESFNKDIVGPALDQLRKLGEELADEITQPLHPDLTALKTLVRQSKQAVEAPTPDPAAIQKLVRELLAVVNRIIQNKDTIFSKRPLTHAEEKNLATIQHNLQLSLNKKLLPPKVIEQMGRFVGDLVFRQENRLEQVGDIAGNVFKEKVIDPVSEVLRKGEHHIQETRKPTDPHLSELRQIFRQYKYMLAHPVTKIASELEKIQADQYRIRIEVLIANILLHIGQIERNKKTLFSNPSSVEKPLKEMLKFFGDLNFENRKPSPMEIAQIEIDIQQLCEAHGAYAEQLVDNVVHTAATTLRSDLVDPAFDRLDQTRNEIVRDVHKLKDDTFRDLNYSVDRTKRQVESSVNHAKRAGSQLFNEADFLVTNTEHRVTGVVDHVAGRVKGIVNHTVATINPPLQKVLGTADKAIDTVDNMSTSWGQRWDELVLGIKKIGSASEDGTPSGLLNTMGKAVGSLVSAGGKALSGKVIASGASLLLTGMKEINRQIPETPEFNEQRKSLGALIAQVQDLEENPSASSLSQLPKALSNAVVVFNKVNICVNGYFLPHGNLDEDFLHHTDYFDHQKILNKARGISDIGEKNYEALAKTEKEKFIRNTAAFLTLIYIYKEICGINVDENYCIALMHRAEQLKVSLKSLVFEDLKRRHTSWWKLFCAWFAYSISNFGIEKFVHRASDAYFEEIFHYINSEKRTGFKGFTKELLTNANEYLPTLDRAYEKVPTIKNRYGSVKTLLGEEMAQPAGNGNQNVDKLYEELIQNVVRKAKAQAKGRLERLVFWVFGKVIVKKQDMVKHIIDSFTESLHDVNGYAYARDTIVCEFLESVYASLAQDDSSKPKTGSAATRFSQGRREALSLFMENLFDVLKKSECNQVKKLKSLSGSGEKETHDYPNETLLNLVKKPVYKATGIKIDDYIMNRVIENASLSLADSFESLAKNDQLPQLAYKFIKLANSVYDTPEQDKGPSDPDKSDTEDRAQILVDDILRISISKSVDELSVAWKKEQDQVNAAVKDLRIQTKKRIASTRKSLEELGRMDLSTLDAQVKVGRLFEESDAFRIEGSKAERNIRKSEWDQINKKALEERHQAIASQTTPLVTAIASIYSQMNVLKNHSSLVPLLSKVMQSARSFDSALFASGNFVSRLSTMEKDLGQIYTLLPAARAEELQKLFKPFADNIREIQDAQRERDAIYPLLSRSSAIDQMLSLKRTQPSEVRKAYEALQQQIAQVIPLSEQHPFREALDRLVQAQPQNEETEKQAFVQLGKRALEKLDAFLGQGMRDHVAHSTALCDAITKDGYLRRNYIPTQKAAIQKQVNIALGHLRDIEGSYIEHLTDVPFLNLQLPVKFLEPKQVKGIVKHAVYNRTKTVADQLVRFASRDEVIPSVVNNMIIGPHNKNERRKRGIYT